jgi:tetratricopeptide (TPR) repeat protein
MILVAVTVSILFAAGCRNPRVDDAHLLITPAEQQAVDAGFLLPGAGEADYVEQAAATRAAYREALASLAAYYRSVGNYTKGQWAQIELRTFDQMVQYTYLAPAEVAPANLQARDIIDAADEIYNQGMKLFREGGGGLIIMDEAKLRESLQYFNRLIAQYPTSDKIDDAAYRSGRIYEYLKNYELAAVYYQRAYQWNDITPYPARYRAAFVMDHRLKMRTEALTLYRLAVEREARYTDNVENAKLRIAALSQPQAVQVELPEAEIPSSEAIQEQP